MRVTNLQYCWEDKVVLVVEDDISSLMLLKAILSKTGAEVLVAEDGETAVDIVKRNDKIDIVLMDIRLKGINGLQATSQIKKIRPNTPIIAQTACAIIGDMEKCIAAGCSAYISKPITSVNLLETMEYFFKRNIRQEFLDSIALSN